MSVYKKNLEHLQKAFPRFSSEVLDLYTPGDELHIEESRAPDPTARLHGRYLYSRHNPRREAERLITGICGGLSRPGVFLGFGLGYQVEEFLSKYPDSQAVIIEKEPSLFLKALTVRDLTSIFTDRVSLLIGVDPVHLLKALPRFISQQIHVIPLSPLVDLYTDYYRLVEECLYTRISRQQVNNATLKRFGKRWIRNLSENLSLMETAEDVGIWKDCFKDIPALVVAAGPSLDDALPFIAEISERSVIISSDTAARALLKHNVIPDFIIVVDPQYWNSRHLDGLDLSETILISESATHPDVFRRSYRKICFSGSIFPLGSFLEGGEKGRYKLGAGGSVSTTAWDFARLTGAGPIALAGLDLGFPDLRPHFRGCYFEERLFSANSRFCPYEGLIHGYLHGGDPFPHHDYRGNTLITDRRLIVYKQWFEEQLSTPQKTVSYTISNRGIKIDGLPYMDIRQLLSRPRRRPEIASVLKKTVENHGSSPVCIQDRLDILNRDLIQLKNAAEKGCLLTRKLIQTVQASPAMDFSGDMRVLDDIDRAILQVSNRQLAAFLITPILEQIEEQQNSGNRLLENFQLSNQLYSEILRSADFHLQLFSRYHAVK